MPRHSAKIPLGKRWPARDGGHLPSDFAKCLTAGTWQTIFLFLKTYFAECQPQALGNFFYFLKTYFAECKPWALGKFFFNFLKLILPSASARHSAIFLLFLKINFAECPLGRHSAKPTLPSAPHGTRQKKIFWAQNFFCGLVTVFQTLF